MVVMVLVVAPDGGGLDGGGGEPGVEVLVPGEGRHHRHVPDVQPWGARARS